METPYEEKIINPRNFYHMHLLKNIRPDQRGFDKWRPLAVHTNSFNTVDSSSLARIGATKVVCGIKAELAKPKESEPNLGYLIANIEFTSFSSTKCRMNTNANELGEMLSAHLNDILVNAEIINLNDLCIMKNKLVWCLYLDLICLDDDGCVIDAAVLALVAALRNLYLPKVTYEEDTNEISVDIKKKIKLPTYSTPVSMTLMIFDSETLIVDPTSYEEELASNIVTLVLCNSKICYLLVPGGKSLNEEQMQNAFKHAIAKEKCVIDLLSTLNGSVDT